MEWRKNLSVSGNAGLTGAELRMRALGCEGVCFRKGSHACFFDVRREAVILALMSVMCPSTIVGRDDSRLTFPQGFVHHMLRYHFTSTQCIISPSNIPQLNSKLLPHRAIHQLNSATVLARLFVIIKKKKR